MTEMENMDKVVKEIGTGPVYENKSVLDEVQKILIEKGYVAAEVYASQYSGTDEPDEVRRALTICQHEGLSPENAAKIIKSLNAIKSGKW
ncbi:MAG: hypothetical protein ACXQT4_01830 [Methanotrichaceae archaeon]